MNGTLRIKGFGIGDGIAKGKIRFLKNEHMAHMRAKVRTGEWDCETETQRLSDALTMATKELDSLHKFALTTVGQEEAAIFEIHKMMLEDEDFVDDIRNTIESGSYAEDAVSGTADKYREMFARMNDEYFSARAADIVHIGERLVRILSGEKETDGDLGAYGERYILIAPDLSPEETIRMDHSKILGFVTFEGTVNSHTAILARSMGIPALVGTGIIDRIYDGVEAIIDAKNNTLTINPDESELAAYRRRIESIMNESEELSHFAGVPTVTAGGKKIMLYGNIGGAEDVDAVLKNDGEGIGLLRSEFLYLGVDTYPSEDRQFEAYRTIVRRMGGKRVIIRTVDIGADKKIGYFKLPAEENPALGFRGIRICLSRSELFRTQLRAICRASAYGQIAVMLPMVVSVSEVTESREFLRNIQNELLTQGIAFDPDMKVGIMLETPAAAIMSDELAQVSDFFSVGTNDLCQYTLAADRQNPLVADICRDNLEPVFRLIGMAAKNIHKYKGKWIGICGELAADTSLTQRFLDEGVDEFSISAPYLLKLRKRIIECD